MTSNFLFTVSVVLLSVNRFRRAFWTEALFKVMFTDSANHPFVGVCLSAKLASSSLEGQELQDIHVNPVFRLCTLENGSRVLGRWLAYREGFHLVAFSQKLSQSKHKC